MSKNRASRRVIATLVVAALALMSWTAWRAARADGTAGLRSADLSSAAYVGAATCASCHQAEHDAWDGSHHELAMQEASPDTVMGDFRDAQFTSDSVTSTFSRRDGAFVVTTDGPDGTLQDFEVAYTYGVDPLQQYLIEMPGGRLQPLSIAWDARPVVDGGQRWFHLYPGQAIAFSDNLHWTGRQQNWNYMCADCHSTNVRKGYGAGTDTFQTTWSEINVSCEACHGPGARHAAWADTWPLARALLWETNGLTAALTERQNVTWGLNTTVGAPRRSTPRTTDTEIQICAQCHSRRAQIADGYTAGASFDDFYALQPIVEGLYHPDGQPLDEVYVTGSFLQSRMYAAGVTCSDCHDPHSQQLRASGNALCVGCHTPASYDAPAHHFHEAASAGAQCVACHMPDTTYMGVDARRDHSFRVPRPDQSVTMDVPNACTGCHVDQTPGWAAEQLRSWLGRDPVGFQRFAEAFHAAEQSAQGASLDLRDLTRDPTAAPIVRASALARLRESPDANAIDAARAALTDPDATVRRSALLLLEELPPRDRAALAAPLLDDPARAVRIQAAELLAPAVSLLSGNAGLERFEHASMDFIASQRYNADRVENRLTLGTFFAELGRVEDAETEYRAAIGLAPSFGPAYVNLADLIRRQGQETEAELTIREGLTRSPGDPALHHALGLSLIRSGDRTQAIRELERAAMLAPDQPAFTYVYAVALNSDGRAVEAIQVLERARLQQPRNRDLLFALATFHRDAGDAEAALRYAGLLTESFPRDPQAEALLRSLQ
jgi:predicted CXXCH cytochrome family protein